jgi:hypothetical protein
MRSLYSALVVTGLLVMGLTATTWGTSQLNNSKSNSNQLIYSSNALTPLQAAGILADLDSAGRLDDAKTTQLIQQLLAKSGVRAGTVKKVIVRPWNAAKNTRTIILLTDLADEARALAVSDPGAPGSKPKKTGK